MFDLLLSSDYMGPDPDGMAATLVKGLGLPEPKDAYRQAFERHAYIAWFLRVHKSLAIAPTRLEPQGHVDRPNPKDPYFEMFLESLQDYQGRFRPIVAHSNVLVTSDMPGLIDSLMRKKVPFRLAPWSEEMPFDRIWIGATPENARYRPDWDGGLMIEVIPLEPLRYPPETFGDVTPAPTDPQPGELIRVVNRAYIVRDLDTTVALASANLDLEPAEPISLHEDEGYRRARYRFGVRHSSTLDVLQPTRGECVVGRYLNVWGPGPYYARIAVHGLDAKADDLANRGTGFAIGEETSACARRVVVDADYVGGAEIEFVEWEA